MAASSSSSNKKRDREEEGEDLTKNLNEKQRKAFDLAVREGKNVLITGQGGTGKSYLIHAIATALKEMFPRKVAITATTGIASIFIGGSTFHKWAQLGLMEESQEALAHRVLKTPKTLIAWKGIKAIIIDEISMFNPLLFTKFDYVARKVRGKPDLPFGGLQVILIGDFLQIPPVRRSSAPPTETYVFETEAWKKGDIHVVHLTENLRQKDELFQSILNQVRFGTLTEENTKLLRTRIVPNIRDIPANEEGFKPAVLMSRNDDVDIYNLKKLKEITDQEEVTFEGATWVNGPSDSPQLRSDLKFLIDNCPVPTTLKLKIGAQVMLRKNVNPAEKLMNGNIGIVVEINKAGRFVLIKFNNRTSESHISKITPHTWEYRGPYDMFPTATFTQLPLTLAWSMSIHKSQGQQFPFVAVDMANIFETGQAYTALSRAESVEGLYLANFNPAKIRTCSISLNFYKQLEEKEEETDGETNKKQRI